VLSGDPPSLHAKEILQLVSSPSFRVRLATRVSSAARWRPSLRTAVLAASSLLVVGLALAIAVSVADHLRRTATDSERGNAEAIVRGYVDPILNEASLALTAEPDAEVEAQLARLVASGDMRRINIWTRDGRVLYSTEPALQGERLGINHEVAEAFAGGSVAEFGTEAESLAAALPERFLEIYVPIRGMSDASPIGVFEVYVDARPIEQRVDDIRRDVFLITLGAGASLLTLLWLAFGGASRRLSAQNRSLTELNQQLNLMAGDLRQSEARFRSLVQNSSDVVAVLDADGDIIYESDALLRVLGHDPATRRGHRFGGSVHPEDLEWFTSLTASLAQAAGEQAAEFRLLHADGSWRWVDAIGLNLLADPAVGGIVLNFRDITERKRLEDQLQHEAFHDPLTGLANRALFGDRVTHALARTVRHMQDQVAVLFLDLDDFKVVNDSLGHAAGDELLSAVAERIRACLRRQDTPARLGGDEFGILVEETDAEAAGEVAERILAALRQPFALDSRQLFAQASIGIAMGSGQRNPSDGDTAEELLRNADAAMYTAKSRGKGRFEFYEVRMHASALKRLELRGRMEASLAAGEFVLHYQPIVELVSGELAGVEALVRWRQPDGRLALPEEFIPLAEETGLIGPLGTWVLEESCRQAAEWRATARAPSLSMAVNVSSRQLQDPEFVTTVANTLATTGLPASELVLELTESALLDEGEVTTTAIASLKSHGVRISLDDFGTGYSSLSHLRRFPIDVLKIDRSFVNGIDRGEEGERTLVRSIIRLAHSLKLETVAEGVERTEQIAPLRALQVRYVQGFLFARPMEARAILRLLHERARLVEDWQPHGARAVS
jgi:diguanylate cyclase (GGDEF)-like protein/PAS domain S-box-containing protein